MFVPYFVDSDTLFLLLHSKEFVTYVLIISICDNNSMKMTNDMCNVYYLVFAVRVVDRWLHALKWEC